MKNKLIVLLVALVCSFSIAGDFGGYSIFEYDNEAFDVNRVYLQYTDELNDDLFLKIRLDVGRISDSEEDHSEDSKLTAYLKNAYIDWDYQNVGKISMGLLSTNSYAIQESTWGYRFISKSPLDKLGWINTADFGVGYSRNFEKISLNFQILNGEGYTSDDFDKNAETSMRILYGESKLNKNDGYNAGLVLTNNKVDDAKVNLLGLFGGWSKGKIRVGAEYNRYDTNDSDVMYANYINYSVNDKWNVFVRNDIVEEVGGDSEHTAYVGAVWKANDKLYISPNILMNDSGEDVRITCMFSY